MPNTRLMKFMNGYVLILLVGITILGVLLDGALGASGTEALFGSAAWSGYIAIAVYVASLIYLKKKGEIDGWF